MPQPARQPRGDAQDLNDDVNDGVEDDQESVNSTEVSSATDDRRELLNNES